MNKLFQFIFIVLVLACSAPNEKDSTMYQFGEQLTEPMKVAPRKSWSTSGKLTCLDSSKEVSLQVQFSEPAVYTVQFAVKPIQQPNPLIPVPVFTEAEIEWSVDGNTIRRRVSVSNSLSISGPAEHVRVRVYDISDDGSLVDVQYDVAISVSKGGRPTTSIPPTLDTVRGVFSVNAAASQNVEIPLDAGVNSVQVLVAPVPAGTPIANSEVIVSQVAGPSIFKVYDPRDAEWVPLSPGATRVTVTNNTAGQIYVSVIFGVDG